MLRQNRVFSASASFVDARGNTSAEGLHNNVHLIKLLYFNTYIFECFSFISAEAIEIEDVDVDPQTKGCQTDNCLVVDRSCQTDMTLADFDSQHGYIQSITTELHDWKKKRPRSCKFLRMDLKIMIRKQNFTRVYPVIYC